MSRQQSKRRRKRYAPASAYAGDVRPTGILGILSSRKTMGIVFLVMALAIGVGGIAGVFSTGVFSGGDDNPAGFVDARENEEDGTPDAEATTEVRGYDAPPPLTIDATKSYTAVIKTSAGDIEVELLSQQAPATVNNFVFLAKDGFYDGLAFHAADPTFSAQAGDPGCTATTIGSSACRGIGDAGYELSETVDGEYAPGTLGMVNASQFFIALGESNEFDQYTPFGRVTSGLDVAQAIQRGTEIESIEIRES